MLELGAEKLRKQRKRKSCHPGSCSSDSEVSVAEEAEDDFDRSSGASCTTPSMVSKWASRPVEWNGMKWTEHDLKDVGISYEHTGFSSPHDLLDEAEKICRRDKLPEEILNAVNFLDDCLDFDIQINAAGKIELGEKDDEKAKEIDDHLDQIMEKLYHQRHGLGDEMSSSQFSITHALRFIQRIKILLVHQYKLEKVKEQFYTDMLMVFGEICGLIAESGDSFRRGITVKGWFTASVPDIRFRTPYFGRKLETTQTVVSMAQAKRSFSSYSKTSSVQLRKRNKLSDTSSPKESERDTSASKKSDFNIHSCVKADLLGQHGGELLAEWKYSATNPYVTGIVACYTKLIITRLKMSLTEVEEIEDKGKLDGAKCVKIQYSKPLDLFLKADRKILYEVLFRLAETPPKKY